MKLHLEIDPNAPGDLSAAYKVLNALKGGAAENPTPAASAPAPAAMTAPPPAPSTAPMPASPPAPPPGVPAMASPSSPPPTAAPAPAAPPPPAAANGISQAQFGEAVNAFAKAYTAKACKARFGELSKAFGVNWTKTSDIPPERYAEVLPWFNVA